MEHALWLTKAGETFPRKARVLSVRNGLSMVEYDDGTLEWRKV